MRLSIAMTVVGIVLLVVSYFPISASDWLPRAFVWLGGVWTAVVGIGLSVMLTEEEE